MARPQSLRKVLSASLLTRRLGTIRIHVPETGSPILCLSVAAIRARWSLGPGNLMRYLPCGLDPGPRGSAGRPWASSSRIWCYSYSKVRGFTLVKVTDNSPLRPLASVHDNHCYRSDQHVL